MNEEITMCPVCGLPTEGEFIEMCSGEHWEGYRVTGPNSPGVWEFCDKKGCDPRTHTMHRKIQL